MLTRDVPRGWFQLGYGVERRTVRDYPVVLTLPMLFAPRRAGLIAPTPGHQRVDVLMPVALMTVWRVLEGELGDRGAVAVLDVLLRTYTVPHLDLLATADGGRPLHDLLLAHAPAG